MSRVLNDIYIYIYFLHLQINTLVKNEYKKTKFARAKWQYYHKHIYDCTLQLKGHESDIYSGIENIVQYIQNMFSWIENNFAIHAKHVTSADSYRKCEWLILFNVIYHKIIGEYRIYNSKLAVF